MPQTELRTPFRGRQRGNTSKLVQYAYKAWEETHPKASGPCQVLVQVCVHQNNRGIIWRPDCFHEIPTLLLNILHRLGRGYAD